MLQIIDLETAIGVVFLIGLTAHLTKRNTINWVINAFLVTYIASHFGSHFFLRYFAAGAISLACMFVFERQPSRDNF